MGDLIYGINDLSDHKVWDELYRALTPDRKSPFFSSGYYQAYQRVEDSEVECFWVREGESFLFYPYLKKNINVLGYDLAKEYFDASGAYGYSGPIANTNDPRFLQRANSEIERHFRDSDIVTEFVRYCPVVGNRAFHTYPDQIEVLDNVYVDLSQGIDWVWSNSFGHRVRTAVRKGGSYGLRTVVKQGLAIEQADMDAFYEVYLATMRRNEAESFYYFDKSYFYQMHEHLKEQIILALTYFEEKVITTELVLCDGEIAYGFLGGTLSDYYNLKANTFQRWELLKALADYDVKKYSMGGGSAKNDSIYAFKMTFADGCDNPFFIGRYVFFPDVYADLLQQWQIKYPDLYSAHKNRVQCYRMTR